MKRVLLLIGAILWIATSLNAQQSWNLLQMDKGGVAEDVQLVYHDSQNDAQDQVWTACMNGGIYRSTWSSGAWSNWTQYIPGKKAFGVDAIEISGTEYVLCASQGLGLRYGSSASGSFTNWNWPNPYTYPDAWMHAGTHDAAFYWPTGSFGEYTPEDRYYVILTSGDEYAGVYEWDDGGSDFDRVAPNQQLSGAHQYSHFYRDADVSRRNVLYVVGSANLTLGQNSYCGALYRITGSYGSENFDRLTPVVANPTKDNYTEVVGFSQWYESGETPVVYYYIFLHRVTSGTDCYTVYVSTNLYDRDNDNGGDSTYTCTDLEGSDITLRDIYDYQAGYRVVGKPHFSSGTVDYHHLWLATGKFGMWYVQATGSGSPTQTQINSGLKRWNPRMVIPDPYHITGNEIMRILFGTHQRGVWYLKFNSCQTGSYWWYDIGTGMKAANPRDVRIYGSEVLAPTFCKGLYTHPLGGSNWTQLPIPNTTLQDDPTFNKGIYKGIKFSTESYYFGSIRAEYDNDLIPNNRSLPTDDVYTVYVSTNLHNTDSDNMGQAIYICPTEGAPSR